MRLVTFVVWIAVLSPTVAAASTKDVVIPWDNKQGHEESKFVELLQTSIENTGDKLPRERPVQAGIWVLSKNNTQLTDSLVFYTTPIEDCQTVVLCSSTLGDTHPGFEANISFCLGERLMFNPMQATVTHTNGNGISKEHTYFSTRVLLEWIKDGAASTVVRPKRATNGRKNKTATGTAGGGPPNNKTTENSPKRNASVPVAPPAKEVIDDAETKYFVLKVWKGNNFNSDASENITFRVQKDLLVLTSSPNCPLVINSINGNTLNWRKIPHAPKDYILPAISKGSVGPVPNLLFEEHCKDPESKPKEDEGCTNGFKNNGAVKCPNMLEFENFIQDNWQDYKNPVANRYAVQINEACFKDSSDSSKEHITSVKLEIQNVESCDWLRICFSKNITTEKCDEASARSIELLPKNGIFIGTDSDKAKEFGVNPYSLTPMRFVLSNVDNGRVTMNYAQIDGVNYGVQREMRLADAGSVTFITLVKAKKCKARLLEDVMYTRVQHLQKYKGVQCLRLSNCESAYILDPIAEKK